MTILILRVQRYLYKSILTHEFVFTGIFTRSTHYVGAGSPVYCPVNWRLSWPAFNIGKCNFLCFISQLAGVLCLINFAIPFTLLPKSLADKNRQEIRSAFYCAARQILKFRFPPTWLIDWLIFLKTHDHGGNRENWRVTLERRAKRDARTWLTRVCPCRQKWNREQ